MQAILMHNPAMATTSCYLRTSAFRSLLLPVLAWPVWGCHGQDAPAVPAGPPQPVWDRTLPPTDGLGVAQQQRGLRVARGIIHLHSVYSHDACDYDPQPGGNPLRVAPRGEVEQKDSHRS